MLVLSICFISQHGSWACWNYCFICYREAFPGFILSWQNHGLCTCTCMCIFTQSTSLCPTLEFNDGNTIDLFDVCTGYMCVRFSGQEGTSLHMLKITDAIKPREFDDLLLHLCYSTASWALLIEVTSVSVRMTRSEIMLFICWYFVLLMLIFDQSTLLSWFDLCLFYPSSIIILELQCLFVSHLELLSFHSPSSRDWAQHNWGYHSTEIIFHLHVRPVLLHLWSLHDWKSMHRSRNFLPFQQGHLIQKKFISITLTEAWQLWIQNVV